MDKVLDYAIRSGAGLWAVLFVVLLTWVLKTNDSRERRLIAVVEKQATALSKIDSIADDVADIKDWVKPAHGYKSGNGEE